MDQNSSCIVTIQIERICQDDVLPKFEFSPYECNDSLEWLDQKLHATEGVTLDYVKYETVKSFIDTGIALE